MWTQEQFDKLKEWATQGVSYGTIAKRLAKTRNAIIGKANREKLPPRIGSLREMAHKKRQEKERHTKSRAIASQERELERALKMAASRKTEATASTHALIAIPTNNFLAQPRGYCKWPHGPVCDQHITRNSYCDRHHEQSRRAE
jgi:hypothetical protein